MTSDVYEEVFVVAVVVPLYLHEGRVLQQSQLGGGDAPAQPGRGGLRRGRHQTGGARLAGVDQTWLERLDTERL